MISVPRPSLKHMPLVSLQDYQARLLLIKAPPDYFDAVISHYYMPRQSAELLKCQYYLRQEVAMAALRPRKVRA